MQMFVATAMKNSYLFVIARRRQPFHIRRRDLLRSLVFFPQVRHVAAVLRASNKTPFCPLINASLVLLRRVF
jgi:hypothetical protein